jgi:hypothetical protein
MGSCKDGGCWLLSVAVGRARALGRGSAKISRLYLNSSDHRISGGLTIVKAYRGAPPDLEEVYVDVLIPELVNTYDALHELLRKATYAARMFREIMDPTPLPVELQIALKRLAETIMTAVLSWRGGLPSTGSVLVACDPRIVMVEAWPPAWWTELERHTRIFYTCKSHVEDILLIITVRKSGKRLHANINIELPPR